MGRVFNRLYGGSVGFGCNHVTVFGEIRVLVYVTHQIGFGYCLEICVIYMMIRCFVVGTVV